MTNDLPVEVTGEVVAGDGRGRQLGFPTANVDVSQAVLSELQRGVYAATVRVASKDHVAVVNLGRQPTFGGQQLRLEAHLLDYAGDLYGTRLCVRLIHHLRSERVFSGAQELAAQIQDDIDAARSCFIRETNSQSQ